MIPTRDRRRATGRFAAALLVLALLAGGCNRRDDSTVSTTTASPPSTMPTTLAVRPATRPSATLAIDGHANAFPAAKLVLTRKPDGLDALLCSDDPPAAIQSSYGGNSFFFEMRLDVDDLQDLPGATWIYKVPDQQVVDSSNGIFLNGDRRQLHPADVRVTFEKKGERVLANLNGRFLMMESHDPGGQAKSVNVTGTLDAAVQEQQ